MSKKAVLVCMSAAAVLALPMCQEFDGPPAAGMVTSVDPVADALLAKAREYRAAGKLGREIDTLKKVALNHPLAPHADEARLMLGKAYERKKDYREAFTQYGKLLDRYPQSPLYTEALNSQLAMAMAAAQGKLKVPVMGGLWKSDMEASKVIEWLRAIIDKAPYNDMSATASSILAGYLVDLKRDEEARMEYARLVEKYPDSVYAPGAQLMVAELWANSRTRGENNLVNISNAREAYEEFNLRFPDHKDSAKAQQQVSNMKSLLVKQQLEVGKYYLNRSREYTSAVFCFEDVIRQRAVNPAAAKEAEGLLVRARALAGSKK